MSHLNTALKVGSVTAASILGVGISAGAAFACHQGDPGGLAATHSAVSTPAAHAAAVKSAAVKAAAVKAAVTGKTGEQRYLGLAQAVEHGEFTVTTASGSEVVDVQAGIVSGLSATGLTVTSADGFSATYVLNSDTAVLGVSSDHRSHGAKNGGWGRGGHAADWTEGNAGAAGASPATPHAATPHAATTRSATLHNGDPIDVVALKSTGVVEVAKDLGVN